MPTTVDAEFEPINWIATCPKKPTRHDSNIRASSIAWIPDSAIAFFIVPDEDPSFSPYLLLQSPIHDVFTGLLMMGT